MLLIILLSVFCDWRLLGCRGNSLFIMYEHIYKIHVAVGDWGAHCTGVQGDNREQSGPAVPAPPGL